MTTGEVLGVVAPRDNPELQFDVFRGTDQRRPDPLHRRVTLGPCDGCRGTACASPAPSIAEVRKGDGRRACALALSREVYL